MPTFKPTGSKQICRCRIWTDGWVYSQISFLHFLTPGMVVLTHSSAWEEIYKQATSDKQLCKKITLGKKIVVKMWNTEGKWEKFIFPNVCLRDSYPPLLLFFSPTPNMACSTDKNNTFSELLIYWRFMYLYTSLTFLTISVLSYTTLFLSASASQTSFKQLLPLTWFLSFYLT